MHVNMIFKGIRLRVVHTKPILFKIPLSEWDGFDMEWLRNWIPDDVIQIQSRSMSDPPLYDIDFENIIYVT